MRLAVCESCNASLPMNETFLVIGRTLCGPCGEAHLEQAGGDVPADAVQRQTDPTVCANCQQDFGDAALPLLLNMPTCPACDHALRHRPFPPWVKLGLCAMLALCVVSFIRNFRFFAGYVELLQVRHVREQGDLPKAAALANAAAAHVPESKDIRAVASMLNGLDLLVKDRSAEALPHLREWQQYDPNNPAVNGLLVQAEMGEAFDARDYDRFLAKALETSQAQPDDARVLASVASAYACKYAVTGQQSYKQEALKYFNGAKQKGAGEEAQLMDFEQRFRHRIDTRQIISRKEFHERFPKGYKGEVQP